MGCVFVVPYPTHCNILVPRRNKMNLQKLQSQRYCTKKIIEGFIETLSKAKENEDMVDFESFLETIQKKVDILQSLNENIFSQTDADNTDSEMISSEEYSLDIKIKLRKFRRFIAQCPSLEDRERNSGFRNTG